jgi:Chaperone of endosialidase
MGGQTGSQQQQTQQTTQLPPWINDAAQQNYGFAQSVAARPLQQYQGQMVPDVSDQLQQSWNTAATATNAGLPQYNAATAGYMGALGQTPMSVTDPGNANAVTAGQVGNTDLSKYMNPYTQSVINSSLPIMQQQLGQSLAANAGTAAQTGAFGGSRFGVQQGTAQAQGALGMANMAAGLNAQNFTQAQAAATGDINRTLQADTTNQASQQTDLARNLQAQQSNQAAQQAKINSDIQASSGLNTTGAGIAQQANNAFTMQNTAGTQQMANAQDQINAQMAKFQQAWGYPTQQLGVLQSALGMTPYGQSTSGTSDTQTYTPTDWAALAGAGVGALGNVFAGKSDIRIKKNLKRVGKGVTGLPIYDFNWKGQKPGAPKTRGPIAQDIEKQMPGAVKTHPVTGVKHVHAGVLGALSHPMPMGSAGALRTLSPISKTQHRRRIRPPQLRGALAGA